MNNSPCNKSKQNDDFEDDEIFDDSAFLANFDNSFKQASRFPESSINQSISKDALNISALCCDEELSGYDKETGKIWIYPTNYPVRDYQFNIIGTALLKNTLVSLPTGLGKTFIAAVIMYNFYRWYPLGKIIFTAPTRPLVAQQIDACYKIIAIPPNDTIEMTGHMQINTRKSHWLNKRVFFATPQVIYNDIKSGICPSEKIRCLVIDEAHRARGNYAYCQIVSTLDDLGHKIYRLLALSATPGSKVEDVVTLVKNLHIAHLELRTEDCIDVARYSHARKINTVVIKLSQELNTLRQQYVEILDWYARRLKQLNILPNSLGNLSKGRIVMLYKEYQTKDRGARHPQHNYIMKDFTLLIALFHGLELLVQHGSRVFLNFFDEHPEKSWIQADEKLMVLLERLRDDLGINPLSLDRSILPDGSVPEIPKNLCFGHPKFDKLKEIIMNHFTKAHQNKQDTRAIVFCEYRESVNLVHCLLLQCRPLIKPQMFVGQGASGKDGKAVVSQKQQVRVMRNFREGACNVLVATCVAEEGLDVGSVDLILCFDISTRSPRRLVQRCGRTGRERGGQVFILVTEGREHQTLLDCMRQRDGLNKRILQSREVESSLYKYSPRMMPRDHTPRCHKMYVTVQHVHDPKEKRKNSVDNSKKGQKDLRNMLLRRSSPSTSRRMVSNGLISEKEFRELYPDGYRDTALLPERKEYWTRDKNSIKDIHIPEESELKLTRWLECQKSLQKIGTIEHSKDSEILVEMLQYANTKRFEVPSSSSQLPYFAIPESPRKVSNLSLLSPQKLILKSPGKRKQTKTNKNLPMTKSCSQKDGDIRALFSVATKSTKDYTKLINDLGIQNDGSIPTRLISLLVDLSLDSNKTSKQCYVCQNICDCSFIRKSVTVKQVPPIVVLSLKELILPDIDLIEDFDLDTLQRLANKTDNKLDVAEIEEDINLSNNFDLELDFLEQNNSPSNNVKNVVEKNDAVDCFDVGNIEDIFADSSPEDTTANNAKDIEKPKEVEKVLSFFGLDSVEDIFADDVIDDTPPDADKITSNIPQDVETKETLKSQNVDIITSFIEPPLSPSILSGRSKAQKSQMSPILCSQNRKNYMGNKNIDSPHSSTPVNSHRKQLIMNPKNNTSLVSDNKSGNLTTNSFSDTKNKSMFTITQLVDMINAGDDKASVLKRSNIFDEVGVKKENENNVLRTSQPARSSSPILISKSERGTSPILSQSQRLRSTTKPPPPIPQMKRSESLIVLDSDSDSESERTQPYDATKHIFTATINDTKHETSPTLQTLNKTDLVMTLNKSQFPTGNHKRKLDVEDNDSVTVSYFFNKKQKLNLENAKTTKDINSYNKLDKNFKNDNTTLYCIVSPRKNSLKENEDPQTLRYDNEEQDDCAKKKNFDILPMFRRESKINSNELKTILKTRENINGIPKKDKFSFDDREDEFVSGDDSYSKNNHVNGDQCRRKAKFRKKRKAHNSFLDTEAALSDEYSASGDELSDDSAGSIVDFICDETEIQHTDVHALYLQSVKSPIKMGAFKIPELPRKYNREEILSQQIEEDSYELNSFCVDSHIGLTQVNDVSELELAEIILEEKIRSKKKSRRLCETQQGDSPDVKLRSKPKKRQILSDSESDNE